MTIGRCSVCQGPVDIPRLWMGLNPPIPTCRRCGATPRTPAGPTMDMSHPTKPYILHLFEPSEHDPSVCAVIVEGWTWTASDPIRCRQPRDRHHHG